MDSKKSKSMDGTKEGLIRAAKSLFATKGYKATTVKEIAEVAGVNISLISYHFDGKEKLYLECVGGHSQKLTNMAKKILQEADSKEVFGLRLRMFIEECFDDFVQDPELVLMAYREAESIGGQTESEILNSNYLEFYKLIIFYIQRGIDLGFVKPELDSHLAAGVLFGGISHFIKMDSIREKYFQRSIKRQETLKLAVKHLEKIFLDGILAS